MASAVERRREEHSRRSHSPDRDRERRRSPSARRKGSPARARSPAKSHRDREKSPLREKTKERVRSPKHPREQSRSPSPSRMRDSRSPSPRTKRLRRAQGEREVAQVNEGDRRKAAHREERDSGKHMEHDVGRDALRDRKAEREVAHVSEGDRRKASHREERDSGRHREHDEGRDASRDRKAEREAAQVTEGDHYKASHREGRDSGRQKEHDEGRDASRDRKAEWEDGRGAAKDRKSDRDSGRDQSRDRRAGRDGKSGASRESLSGRDDDKHDSSVGRSDREVRKAASSREQKSDPSDKKDSIRERMTDRDERNGGSGRSSWRGRSISPEEHRHRGRHESRASPRVPRAARAEDVSSRGDEVSRSVDADSVARMKAAAEALEAKEKQKPSFELSGKLAEETNKVAGVNLLYSEPPEARKSEIRWRLYVFKGGEPLNEPLYVHRMSCYLFGRERKVADIPTDHPSCSKQHAVLQYRLVEKEQSDGMMSKKVSPYLMDLDSTNGTFINENRIEPRRYYELFEKDTIKFGNSSREYVLLHENSAE